MSNIKLDFNEKVGRKWRYLRGRLNGRPVCIAGEVEDDAECSHFSALFGHKFSISGA
jgi:hypothetical protein